MWGKRYTHKNMIFSYTKQARFAQCLLMRTFHPHLETFDTLLHNILREVSAAFALLLPLLIQLFTIKFTNKRL